MEERGGELRVRGQQNEEGDMTENCVGIVNLGKLSQSYLTLE